MLKQSPNDPPLSRHRRTSGGQPHGPLGDAHETSLVKDLENTMTNASSRRKRSRNAAGAAEPASKSTGGTFAERRSKANASVSSAESARQDDVVRSKRHAATRGMVAPSEMINIQLKTDAARMGVVKKYAAAVVPGAALIPSAQYKLANQQLSVQKEERSSGFQQHIEKPKTR